MKNIENKVKWIPVIVVLCVIFTSCTRFDEYKKYMPEGEIIYPQKADSVNTYPGRNRIQLEWAIIDPKVSSCEVFYEQSGIQGKITVPVHGSGNYKNDTVRVTIPNLEETNYKFKIVSYDNLGHASIPVETEEQVYGERYERSLNNRQLKSVEYDADKSSLNVVWYNADANEIGIDVKYTDIQGGKQSLFLTPSETNKTISDFKVSEPLVYKTQYKPTATAIDLFYAQTKEVLIPYWKNITAEVLSNTASPFTRGAHIMMDRFYLAEGWTANAAASANGNIDGYGPRNDALTMWTYSGFPTITNGKLYQTVSLEAGKYRFNAFVFETGSSGYQVYATASSGNELPNTDDVESQALGFIRVPSGIAMGANVKISFEFTLTTKSIISLGFAGTLTGNQQVFFSKVELWRLQ